MRFDDFLGGLGAQYDQLLIRRNMGSENMITHD